MSDKTNPFELMEGWRRNWPAKGNPLIIWSHPEHGTFVNGLFAMHDTMGFPLTEALIECKKRGWKPCLSQFMADAVGAGWTKEKAAEVVRISVGDANSMCISE